VFFGFGALFLPFALGALLAWFSVTSLLFGATLLCAISGVFALLLRFPSPKQRQVLPVTDISRFLRSSLVLVFAFLLFFESGVEFTLGGFISTYLMRDMRVASVSVASWILAAYWASIMISRAVQSRMALAADPYRTLLFCSLCAGIGGVMAAIAPVLGVAAFAIMLCGWSLAGIYPAVLGIAGSRFESHSGTVFGILFAVALSGGMIVPWLAGRIGGASGLRWVFAMIAASFFAVLLLSRVAARVDNGRPVSSMDAKA
jgi:fucose permease